MAEEGEREADAGWSPWKTQALKELNVRKYKNLRSIRLDVGQRTVLYGPNGVGKTNIIEALALAAGTEATLTNAARRLVTPDPGAIEIVIGPWTGQGAADEHLAAWWSSIGVSELPDSWTSGINESWLSNDLKAALSAQEFLAVRYTLVDVSGLEAAADFDRGRAWREDEDEDPPRVKRRFDATLCALTSALLSAREAREQLALDTDLTADSGQWTDILPLRPVDSVPLGVSWLSRERTDDELWFDYERSVTSTAAAVDRLIKRAQEVLADLSVPESDENNSLWVATLWFAVRAQETTGPVISTIDLEPQNLWLELKAKGHPAASAETSIGTPGDPSWMTQLSSGERFAVDEGMLDAEEALGTLQRRLGFAEALLFGLDGEEIQLEILYRGDPFGPYGTWDYDEVEHLVDTIQRIASDRYGSQTTDFLFGPALRVLRVFDEPERHLHPAAQRARAAQLDERSANQQTLIATHALPFLGRSGWDHLHVIATPEGTVLERFDAKEVDVLRKVSRSMGVTSAEILSRYRYVLYVEGLHDKAFLEGFQGDFLRDYAVLLIPLHGLDEAIQIADSYFVPRFMDAGVGILADHSRTRSGKPAPTKETRLLDDLSRAMKARGLRIDTFRLERIDIIAYLNDDVVRDEAPRFPGFKHVEDRWRLDRNVDFKSLAQEMADGLRFTEATVRRMASKMAERQDRAPQDLADFLGEVAAAASRTSTDSAG